MLPHIMFRHSRASRQHGLLLLMRSKCRRSCTAHKETRASCPARRQCKQRATRQVRASGSSSYSATHCPQRGLPPVGTNGSQPALSNKQCYLASEVLQELRQAPISLHWAVRASCKTMRWATAQLASSTKVVQAQNRNCDRLSLFKKELAGLLPVLGAWEQSMDFEAPAPALERPTEVRPGERDSGIAVHCTMYDKPGRTARV